MGTGVSKDLKQKQQFSSTKKPATKRNSVKSPTSPKARATSPAKPGLYVVLDCFSTP